MPAGANAPLMGGKNHPVVITKGQTNATPVGGVRSLDATVIAGYNRGTGNDFPRIAWNRVSGRVIVAWNDASLHPLGDIWLRSLLRRARQPKRHRAGKRRLRLRASLPAGPVGSLQRAHLHVMV